MKKRNIKAENERVEGNFPKNSDNISKDELHEHFDLDKDGKVTLDEYAEHIDYHCKNPNVLEDKLEQEDYERGFKYKKGGEIDKIVEKVKNSDDVSTEINTLITQKYGHNPELEDKVMERYYEKYGESYAKGGYLEQLSRPNIYTDPIRIHYPSNTYDFPYTQKDFDKHWRERHQDLSFIAQQIYDNRKDKSKKELGLVHLGMSFDLRRTEEEMLLAGKEFYKRWLEKNNLKDNYAKGGKILSKEVFEWVEVYKRNNKEHYDNLNAEVESEEEKIDLNNANDLPEVFFEEIREKLEEEGYSEKEIDNAIEEYFNKYYDEDEMFIAKSYAKGGTTKYGKKFFITNVYTDRSGRTMYDVRFENDEKMYSIPKLLVEQEAKEVYAKGGKTKKSKPAPRKPISIKRGRDRSSGLRRMYGFAKGGRVSSFERVLKDSGFNKKDFLPPNELEHNRGQYTAVIGKDNKGEVVHLSKYTPNYGRLISSVSFDNPGELTDFLDKNQIYSQGGKVRKRRIVQYPYTSHLVVRNAVSDLQERKDYDYGVGERGYALIDIDVEHLDMLISHLNQFNSPYEVVIDKKMGDYKYKEGGKTLLEEFKKGGLTKDKAKKMLEDGIANGKPLTDKQKRYFRAVANNAKYSKGGYTKEGVRLRTALSQMKNVRDANGMFVYNPYYEQWGWINDEQLSQGVIPHRVKVHYNKTSKIGKGVLNNVNDLIVVREGYYGGGGDFHTEEHIKREKSRKQREMKKGGKIVDRLKEKWALQDEIMYLEDELREVKEGLENLFTDMEAEAGQKGEEWTDADANRYGELMNKAETRKLSIENLIKEKTKEWNKLEEN